MTYEEYRDRVIAAQEQWNQERTGIYLTQHLAQFSSIFDGETQPPHITGPDNFDTMSLADMQAAVSAMKPSTAHSASEVWSTISSDLSTALSTFNKAFEATTNADNGWSGAAASAAVAAVNNYAAQSSSLPAAALAVSLKLSEMRTGLEQTQALMPGITVRPDTTGKTLPSDGELKMDDYSTEEATEEGRRILRTVYGQVAVQSDTGVPFMPAAPKIADGSGDPGIPGPGPGGQSGGNSGGGANSGSPNGTPDPGSPSTPGVDDPIVPEASPSIAPQQDGATTAASASSPAATTPASPTGPSGTPTTSTPSSQVPSSTTPLATTPGVGRGGGASGGTRGGGAIGGAGGGPAAGRSLPGAPTGDRAGPAAAAAGRSGVSGAGRAPMMGAPGMGAPGAGKGSGDDQHKSVPDYLISKENGELLLGLKDHKTVPPVIGGDYRDAEQ